MYTSIEDAYEALPKKEFVIKNLHEEEDILAPVVISIGTLLALPEMIIEFLFYLIFELILGGIVKLLGAFFSLFTGNKKTQVQEKTEVEAYDLNLPDILFIEPNCLLAGTTQKKWFKVGFSFITQIYKQKHKIIIKATYHNKQHRAHVLPLLDEQGKKLSEFEDIYAFLETVVRINKQKPLL